MKVRVDFDVRADEEFKEFDLKVRKKFQAIFRLLENGVRLSSQKFKHLSETKLYEMRVKEKGSIYRGIGGYVTPYFLVVLFFKKKSQKTPARLLATAEARFKEIKKYVEENKL